MFVRLAAKHRDKLEVHKELQRLPAQAAYFQSVTSGRELSLQFDKSADAGTIDKSHARKIEHDISPRIGQRCYPFAKPCYIPSIEITIDIVFHRHHRCTLWLHARMTPNSIHSLNGIGGRAPFQAEFERCRKPDWRKHSGMPLQPVTCPQGSIIIATYKLAAIGVAYGQTGAERRAHA